MKEADTMRAGLLAMAKAGATMFRNNIGFAVVGVVTWIKAETVVKLRAGDAVVRNARPFHAGLCEGSSDTIGWTEIVVTKEMVGKKIAVFTAVEYKKKTPLTQQQGRFITTVQAAGGLAGVARSAEEAAAIVKA